jgi:hypothetical protein
LLIDFATLVNFLEVFLAEGLIENIQLNVSIEQGALIEELFVASNG